MLCLQSVSVPQIYGSSQEDYLDPTVGEKMFGLKMENRNAFKAFFLQ